LPQALAAVRDCERIRRGEPTGGFLWQKALSAGARRVAEREWKKGATAGEVHRVEAARRAGRWVLAEAEGRLAVRADRLTYAIAMRMRFGLKVRPAFALATESRCAPVKRGGQRCDARLDDYGHHAVACGSGGGFVARHNGIVRALKAELQKLRLAVRSEVWVEDLAEHRDGYVREARMDLVVDTDEGAHYLDVTCYHPFSQNGRRRTFATGGTPEAQECRKRDRYPVRDRATLRRRTMSRFVPITVAVYGQVGPAARALFRQYEHEARRKGILPKRALGGVLAAAVTGAAVVGAAGMLVRACSPPDGQERAHLLGRAAS